MMKSIYIEDIFKDYLATKDTSYAILINGAWGSGKTYFWKNTLTKYCEDAKLKPVYLSLNGINKIETLDYQLKIKLIPFLNKLDVKKSASIGTFSKNILSTVIKAKWDIDAEKILKDVDIDLNLFSNSVVCFDDLERCKIPLSEVLGYINDYVEHKKLKVVFLSHEKENDDNYNAIKEKVIGRTLNFKNDLLDTLPLLFEKYKTNNIEFYTFLQSKKEYIYDLLAEYREENLRNIAFYIDTLSKVFPFLESHSNYCDEVIMFSLIITIEFKTGKLTSNDYQDFKEYEDLNSPFALFNFSKPKKQNGFLNIEDEKIEPKTELELLHEKYLSKNIEKYFFYASIYQFILTGYLDKQLLTNELESRYPEIPPIEVTSFRKLLNYNFREIKNDEFEETTKEVFKYAVDGKYGIYDYLQLARFFNYFSESKLIDLSLADIQEGLKKGTEISKQRKDSSKKTFDNVFHFKNKDDDEVIKELVKEAHDIIEKEKELLKTNKLIEAIKNNDSEAIELIFKEFRAQKELFEQLEAKELFEKLLSSENSTISHFNTAIEERYNFGNVKDFLGNDINLLKVLSEEAENFLKDKSKYKVREFLISGLSIKLKEICLKLV